MEELRTQIGLDNTSIYSSYNSYSVGDLAFRYETNSKMILLFKCKTACSPAAWSVNWNCFEMTSIHAELSSLNEALFTYDYNHKVDLSSYVGNNAGYTPPRNGFLVGFAESSSSVNTQFLIHLNSMSGPVISGAVSQLGIRQSFCVPVQKGTTYYIQGNIVSGTNSQIYFA